MPVALRVPTAFCERTRVARLTRWVRLCERHCLVVRLTALCLAANSARWVHSEIRVYPARG